MHKSLGPIRQHRGGFTLIELLVVIAIISLLVSILLPSLNRAKDLAYTSACGASMKAVAMGCLMYSEESNRIFPPLLPYERDGWSYGAGQFGHYRTDPTHPQYYAEHNCWADILVWEGLVDPNAFACPAEKNPDYVFAPDKPIGIVPPFWFYARADGTGYYNPLNNPTGRSMSTRGPHLDNEVKKASEKYMLRDSRDSAQYASLANYAAVGEIGHTGYTANYAYCDGHVDNLSWGERYGRSFDPTLPVTGFNGNLNIVDANLKAAGRAGIWGHDEASAEWSGGFAWWMD